MDSASSTGAVMELVSALLRGAPPELRAGGAEARALMATLAAAVLGAALLVLWRMSAGKKGKNKDGAAAAAAQVKARGGASKGAEEAAADGRKRVAVFFGTQRGFARPRIRPSWPRIWAGRLRQAAHPAVAAANPGGAAAPGHACMPAAAAGSEAARATAVAAAVAVAVDDGGAEATKELETGPVGLGKTAPADRGEAARPSPLTQMCRHAHCPAIVVAWLLPSASPSQPTPALAYLLPCVRPLRNSPDFAAPTPTPPVAAFLILPEPLPLPPPLGYG